MKNGITEMVFILDRSGSMSGMEADTVGGFNSMIQKQQKLSGTAYVSTVLFSNSSVVLHDRVSIDKIEPLTEHDYCVGGSTALLDALGAAIHHIANVHKYARAEDVPEHTIFIITTDGMENASHEYGIEAVRHMILHEQEKYGWEFMFVAANIDAAETAAHIGIRPERSANYRQTDRGMRSVYDAMDCALGSVRSSKPLDETWKAHIDNK